MNVITNLILNLFLRITQIDASIGFRGVHLGLCSLKSRQERGEDQRRLSSFKARRNVPCHPEVGILIDGARDQTRDVVSFAEDVRERGSEARRRLDGRERRLAHAIVGCEAEDGSGLVAVDNFPDLDNVLVEGRAHVVKVVENERFRWVKAHRNDVFHVLPGHFFRFVHLENGIS